MTQLKFGVHLFPYHRTDHNPTVQFQDDLELIELLDRLGYDEVWIGEHHSTGWQNIGAPELVIAAAAERTKHINFGTGVTSVPYHHPFIVTDRMVQLDIMLRGRFIWGLGAGSLAQDAAILGIDPLETRRMTDEGVEAIVSLLRNDGPVTRRTDWFQMQDAFLHLSPFNEAMDIRVASMKSPSGPTLAGKYGVGIYQFGAFGDGESNPLADAWQIAQESAEKHGNTVTRDQWSVLLNIHVAETEKQAREEARWGLQGFIDYVSRIVPFFDGDTGDFDKLVDELNASSMVIGTPDLAVERINQVLEMSGGVGTLVIGHTEMADPRASQRSYELIAREVMPRFAGRLHVRQRGDEEMVRFGATATQLKAAQDKASAEHDAERAQTPVSADD